MLIELQSVQPEAAYALMTQTIVPRPIAWVLTENDDASHNLAPFSYFNAVCSRPPTLMISIGLKPDRSIKDTWHNIDSRGEFVVHIAHQDLASTVTASSASLPYGQSELTQNQLDIVDVPGWSLPRVAPCRIAYYCAVSDVRPIGDQQIVFGEVLNLYLDESIVTQDAKGRPRVDARQLDALGRLGGSEYVTAGDILSIPRPD